MGKATQGTQDVRQESAMYEAMIFSQHLLLLGVTVSPPADAVLLPKGRKKETNDDKRRRKAMNKEIQGQLNWVGPEPTPDWVT